MRSSLVTTHTRHHASFIHWDSAWCSYNTSCCVRHLSSGSWDAGYRLIDLIADKIYEERVARHNLHTVGSVCSAAVLQCLQYVVIMQQIGARV